MARKIPSVLISPEKVRVFVHWTGSHTNSISFQAAPQLWKLEIVRDRDRHEYAQTSRLNLKHTFALKGPVDIAGPCHFGGKDDQFVLCGGKGWHPFCLYVRWVVIVDHCPSQLVIYIFGTERQQLCYTVYDLRTHPASEI